MLEKVKMALLAMQRYSWEQAVCAHAFMEAGDMEIAIQLCYDAVNRQTECGRLGNMGYQHGVTDPIAILPVMLKAFEITKDPRLKTASDKAWQWALTDAPRNKDGIVYHMDNVKQFWVDSIYMLPPALISGGYVDEAIKQADGQIAALYDNEANLFRHIWDEDKQQFEVSEFWGVGNGWAIAGLGKLIEALPPEKAETRNRYIEIVTKTIRAALAYKKDNLFYNFLDRPADYSGNFIEGNFAQMLCYTVTKGVKQNWLPAEFATEIKPIREAIHKLVDDYGYVTPVCGAPFFNKPGIAPEGQAFFILMESVF